MTEPPRDSSRALAVLAAVGVIMFIVFCAIGSARGWTWR